MLNFNLLRSWIGFLEQLIETPFRVIAQERLPRLIFRLPKDPLEPR